MPLAWFEEDIFLKKERQKAREIRRSQWWKRQCAKGRCHYCGAAVPASELTMDHVIPLSRGGKSEKANLVTACKDCNTKKKEWMPLEWEKWLAENGKGK